MAKQKDSSKKPRRRGMLNDEVAKQMFGLRETYENLSAESSSTTPSTRVSMIPLKAIEVNPWQPRSKFETEAMEDLIDSIKEYGLIQPVTVRKMNSHSFQLISGERRVRACKEVGLKEIPAYIREANDKEMIEMALVENLERSDLNPMEIAITYGRLKKEFDWTDEYIAEKSDKKRSSITNFMRLLSLPEVIQTALKSREITMGHAKPICGLKNLEDQIKIFNQISENNLSVRATEALVAAYKNPKKKNNPKLSLPLDVAHTNRKVEDDLCKLMDRKVILKRKKKNGKGQVVIPFTNDADLNSILDFLEKENF